MQQIPTPSTETGGAAVRTVMLRDLPMLVVDITPPAGGVDTPMALQDGLYRLLSERGLAPLPRFYGVELPRGVRVGLTLERDVARLEDDENNDLLRIPREGLDEEWLARALQLKGTMLCAGHALGVTPDSDSHELCDTLDIAATAGRVLGAIVGVAEPKQGLPLIF